MSLSLSNQNLVWPEQGETTWRAPSNIALVKYWGKKGVQLPQNPSLSLTLKNCHTTTTLICEKADKSTITVYVDDVINDGFKPKIEAFFDRIRPYCSIVDHYALAVKTSNSFPHSSGIASSASGMAALALCVVDMEQQAGADLSEVQWRTRASFFARLGSGSACRSIAGGFVTWGDHASIPNSTDDYGVAYPHPIAPPFHHIQDTVLLIDQGVKAVSSSVGHGLMKNHPFASARFDQARRHIDELQGILKNGDWDGFIRVVESEALTLHAMMMTSQPSFVLMKPETLGVIEKIRAFREETGMPVCFTLDAGANVHCLYPRHYKEQVEEFIEKELVACCQNGAYITDEIGTGAEKR